MDLKDIREKRNEDLIARLRELAEEMFRLTCVSEGMTPQRGNQKRAIRREVARINTVMRQRQLTTETAEVLGSIEARLKELSGARNGSTEAQEASKLRAQRTGVKRVQRELEGAQGK